MIINTVLNDGTPICIRRVAASDEQRLKDGIKNLSKHSRYLRFFSGMREAPQSVINKLIDVDGYDHIAWGALRSDLDDSPALGIVHAFREESDPRTAQYSVAVVDQYHGRGLARLLTAVLLLDCYREGLREFAVHILAENEAAIALTRSLGGKKQGQDGSVTEFDIEIARAIAALKAEDDVPGLAKIFDSFSDA
ncbi:GNAT family N-acetyltransferase [Erythrobacter sp. MTPC3]|uniref:GNAT family N-acetyltransferase n=1 Tax=Erythrobacter sp. MTPC3 TaxID=3056564 RepID=UPI0036F1DBCE